MSKLIVMMAPAENYKGIEFVQISSLPIDQKKHIYKSVNHKLIIHILKEKELLNDCLQYQHYVIWYENIFKSVALENPSEVQVKVASLTLAFK